jgi:hypothetical protein
MAAAEDESSADLFDLDEIEWDDSGDEEEGDEAFSSAFESTLSSIQNGQSSSLPLDAIEQRPENPPSEPHNNNAVIKESEAALAEVLARSRARRDAKTERRRARDERRAAIRRRLNSLKATLLCRMGIALNLNGVCDSMRDHIASTLPPELISKLGERSMGAVQQYVGYVRRSFHHKEPSTVPNRPVEVLTETVLQSKEGSECAIIQLIVGMLRAMEIPARVVVRFRQEHEFDDRDIWAEVFVESEPSSGTGMWYRVLGSAWRVLQAEQEEKRFEKGKTVDPMRKRANFGALDAFPRRIDDLKSTICLLAFGDGDDITNVSARYMTRPLRAPHPLIRYLSSVIGDWNADISLAHPAYSKEGKDIEQRLMEDNSPVETSVPTSLEGFKKSTEFVLGENLLHSKRALVKEGVKPINLFRGQPVYRKRDLEVLKTEWGWRRLGRRLIESEMDKPKSLLPERTKIMGLNSADEGSSSKKKKLMDPEDDLDETMDIDEEVLIDPRRKLFGESQTVQIDPKAIDESTLAVPTNEYGNVELFCAEMVPRGGVHLLEPFADKACGDLSVPFAPCVVGFEYRDRRARPKFSGIICARSAKERILERAQEIAEQVRVDEEQRKRKQRAQLWLDLLETNWLVMQTASGSSSQAAAAPSNYSGRTSNSATSCTQHEFANGRCARCGVREADVEFF